MKRCFVASLLIVAMVVASFAIALAEEEMITNATPQLGAFPPDDVMKTYKSIFFDNLLISGSTSIIAARSKQSPGYWFDWVRDSALAIRAAQTALGLNSTEIGDWYNRYETNNVRQFQSPPNPGFDIRGDVKFEADNQQVFTGPWGRHQNDGPASRASIRIDYADWLLERGGKKAAAEMYGSNFQWGGIKWELDYVRTQWSAATFDVWEECQGYHFYTLMVSRRALYKGAVLAYRFADYDYALELLFQAAAINNAIPSHFNDKEGYIWPMINTVCPDDRQAMDIAIQLATLHGRVEAKLMADVQGITKAWWQGMCTGSGPLDSRCPTMKSYLDNWQQFGDSYWVQPRTTHSYNLFSLWRLSQWSRSNFYIAQSYPTYLETLIARYAWDKYDGYGKSLANPWFLANFATSEIWSHVGTYFKNLDKNPFEPNFTFYAVHYNMWNSFVSIIPNYCPQLGNMLSTLYAGQNYSIPKTQFTQCAAQLTDFFFRMSDDAAGHPFQFLGYANNIPEQLHKDYGTGTGANYLTWSYGALINAAGTRANRNSPLQ